MYEGFVRTKQPNYVKPVHPKIPKVYNMNRSKAAFPHEHIDDSVDDEFMEFGGYVKSPVTGWLLVLGWALILTACLFTI